MSKVSAIIDRKGAEVATVAPSATLADAAALLAEHGIGALVVSSDGRRIEGVLSERDIVRRLADTGAATLDMRVTDAMTAEVTTCTWETTVDELVVLMTERRIRHVPVEEGGALVGIVSIGDVVKSRLDELTLETDQLQAYVTGSY
jgi:CBS domain-containing protein